MTDNYAYEIVLDKGYRVRKVGERTKLGKLYDSFEKIGRCIVSKIAQEGICFNQVRIRPEVESVAMFRNEYYGEVGRYIAAKLGLKEQGEAPDLEQFILGSE
ncbi:TPA: hypothetical protein HA219_02640 [Candidatus Woesearchaeota archaeon]|nr:hypothetical protein [Candidatus Woesearchaeota archaeon]HIH39591.1 hypothetical protein [Candidatus Woesearchaeota archaeon]